MKRDKLTTLATIVTLCGCAVKMVITLKEHGARKEIDDAELVEE